MQSQESWKENLENHLAARSTIKFAFGFDTVLHEIIQFGQIVLARTENRIDLRDAFGFHSSQQVLHSVRVFVEEFSVKLVKKMGVIFLKIGQTKNM